MIKRAFAPLLALFICMNVVAQVGQPNTYTFQSAPEDPLNARIYTLKNGLKVYLSVYTNSPRIQTYIAVKAGSKNDPPGATGLAHYLEHMVFKGTDVFGTKDFARENVEIKKIEVLFETYRITKDEAKRKSLYHQIDSISGVAAKYAIANEYDKLLGLIGAKGTNAYTSFDETVYTNDIPSNQLDNFLKIEAERFRKPVLRLFHTELEAVYEEKNRGLDSDNNKVWEEIFAALFKNHTYGTQTTIGTIEHLKNPSMVEISRYYDRNYVPNNMAIVMSGDFNPDTIIRKIEKYFGSMPSKPVEPYKFQPEAPITNKIVKVIVGPDPESVTMTWRFSGEGTKDADICTLLQNMLSNGTAGLFDLNLNQAQKVLSSSCYYYALKDYSVLMFQGEAKEGQTLEDVEKKMLAQVDLIKKGDFPVWLMDAVMTDLKLQRTKMLENNNSRAEHMLTAFTYDLDWAAYVKTLERISKISQQELLYFVNKNISAKNYVVAYKRTGEDKNVVKVEKPAITPVELDKQNSSEFATAIGNNVPAPIAPKFINYTKDLSRTSVGPHLPLLHNKNNENKLFEYYYKFDMGSNNNQLLPVAVKYIPYLATGSLSAAQIKQEFYKLGCSFNVFTSTESTWISLTGLDDHFEKALKLFEDLLRDPAVNEFVLKNMISDIKKERNDRKLQKSVILSEAMVNYARFGPRNPFSNVPPDSVLNRLTVKNIRDMIMGLTSYEHKVLYYGPRDTAQLKPIITANHPVNSSLTPVPAATKFEFRPLDNTVYFVDYDMKQVELITLSNGHNFSSDDLPLVTLYNSYFGGGMSSVIFQDLRESKALAYATSSQYKAPNKKEKPFYNVSYIGAQADKLPEAIKGLTALLKDLPESTGGFNTAREMVINDMRTQRVTRSGVIFSYLGAQDLGLNYDVRKNIFEKAQNYTFADLKNFHQQHISGKPTTFLVLGKKESVRMDVLQNLGIVKQLSLQEIFGY